jgi:hypothetical protein
MLERFVLIDKPSLLPSLINHKKEQHRPNPLAGGAPDNKNNLHRPRFQLSPCHGVVT